jgi:hypothetical protein
MLSGQSLTRRLSVRAGTPLQSRKAMLETLVRHLVMVRLSVRAS